MSPAGALLTTKLPCTLSARRSQERALGAREIEIMRCERGGLTNAGVAQHLVLSENTIAQHLTRIYTKLGVANRRHAQRAFERLVVVAANSEFPSAILTPACSAPSEKRPQRRISHRPLLRARVMVRRSGLLSQQSYSLSQNFMSVS